MLANWLTLISFYLFNNFVARKINTILITFFFLFLPTSNYDLMGRGAANFIGKYLKVIVEIRVVNIISSIFVSDYIL